MAVHELRAADDATRVGSIDNAYPPTLSIDSGDTVVTQTLTHFNDAITPQTTLEEFIRLKTEVFPDVGAHTLTGPIEVRGARPGDMLRVQILELQVREHGYNFHLPAEFATGLLPEEFPEGRLQHFRHDLAAMTTQLAGVTVPLEPMLGIVAVAPREPGHHGSLRPGSFGGNLDLRDAGAGCALYLPVQVEGALLSVGDGHSRQGHGEVCTSAIETGMSHVVLRVDIVATDEPCGLRAETADAWITLGVDEDLLEASRMAVREMIALLVEHRGMDRADAYALCSVAVDLSVTQIVNGVRGVHARIAKSLLG
ncbi:MAG: amidase [Nitriliruptorales bacterium]|nr:amidase [Nitriliruptorales bacterium]